MDAAGDSRKETTQVLNAAAIRPETGAEIHIMKRIAMRRARPEGVIPPPAAAAIIAARRKRIIFYKTL